MEHRLVRMILERHQVQANVLAEHRKIHRMMRRLVPRSDEAAETQLVIVIRHDSMVVARHQSHNWWVTHLLLVTGLFLQTSRLQ